MTSFIAAVAMQQLADMQQLQRDLGRRGRSAPPGRRASEGRARRVVQRLTAGSSSATPSATSALPALPAAASASRSPSAPSAVKPA